MIRWLILLLLFYVQWSYAVTPQPSSTMPLEAPPYSSGLYTKQTANAVCAELIPYYSVTAISTGVDQATGAALYACKRVSDGQVFPQVVKSSTVCPGGTTYQNGRCIGPLECPSGYTITPDKTQCISNNPCEGKQNTPDEYAWISYNNGSSPFGAKCKGGCVVYQTGPVSHPIKNPDGATYVGGTHDKHALMKTQHTNEQCTNQSSASSGNTPQPNLPPPKPLPPCAEGEGVLTTSIGKIACVPDGTLGARKPVQQTTDERNNDGSKTVDKNKTTTKDPLTGATTTTTTTTTTDENGNVTVSTGSVSSGAGGQGDNSGEEPGQCAKEPDSPMCRKGEPSAKGNFSGDEDAELTRVKQELRDTWAQVSTQARAMWSGSLGGGGGSLPCPPPVVVMGRPFDICLSRYEGQLSMIGSAVMLIAALLSVFIIFRR